MKVGSEPDRQAEADRNFEAFQKKLPELLKEHAGKFALLRDGEIVQFFDTARDAMVHGQSEFEDGLFSVQEVTEQVTDLGFFSHALHFGRV